MQEITIDEITREFSDTLKRQLGSHIKNIILFGSRARSDYSNWSDYDFLVIVDKKNKGMREILLDNAVFIMNKYYALVSCLLWEEKEWEFKKNIPIGLNILKEGIILR
ncbi:MAG: nucleotidyltransferase domain-containing protein [Candidatus Hydrogenedentota bacterium]